MKTHVLQLLRLAVLLPAIALAIPAHADAVAASRFYEDGLARFERRDTVGAIIQLKNALQQDRNMLAAHLLLAKAYLAEGDVGPAEVAFREALRLGVNRAEVAVPLARIYLLQGRPQTLLDAVSVDGLPASVRLEVLTLRGTAYASLGKVQEAARSFADARAINPGSAIPLVAEVPMLLAAGRGEAARDAAALAVTLASQDAAAYNARASVAHASGDLGGALKDYEQAIVLKPDYLDARVARAGILVDLGRDADARKDLDDLAAGAPAEPRVAYLRALLANRRGDAQAASMHLDEVARLVDSLPIEWLGGQEQLLMAGALAHHAGRQYEKARKYLEVLHTRYPRNQGARKLLAAVYIDTADYPRATGLLENVLRAQPGDAQALHLLGRTYLAQKRYAKATELLERAAALGGGDPGVHTSLGFSQLGQGDRGAAISNLRTAFDRTPGDLALAVSLSNLYMREGEANKALDVAQRVSAALPGNPAALNLLGMIRAASGDLANGRTAYVEALRRDPAFLPARLNLARADVEEGRFGDARTAYAVLLRKNSRDADVMYESALLEQRAGQPVEALRWVEKAAAEQPADVRIGLMLITLRAATGDKPGARDAARALSARRPGNLAVLEALARAEIDVDGIKAAQQTLREMTRLAEFDAGALVRIGYLQLAAANPEGATYCAQKALQGRPDDAAARVLAVEAAIVLRDLERAGEQLKLLRAAHPANVDGLRLAGDLAFERKQYAVAAESYRQAFERQSSTWLLERQARVFVHQGNPAAAVPIVQGWLKQHQGDMSAREMLAELYMRAENWRAARSEYERLVREGHVSGVTYNNLANVLIALQEGDPIGMAEKAVALTPGDVGALDTLGWALALAGRFDEAIRYLRDARLRAPENPELRWHLGYVLAKTGRPGEAIEELNFALQTGQSFVGMKQARELWLSLQ